MSHRNDLLPNYCVGYDGVMTRASSTGGRVSGESSPAVRDGIVGRTRPPASSGRGTGARPEAVTAAAGAARRSIPADDPLAAERTRWLAGVVGGGRALAGMLGVSPSQTSRWASGLERPGTVAAPLLIDLEHVLARVRLVWAEPAATTWMTSTNAHLGGARPVDVLRLRGPGPVLEALDAGTWGSAA